MTSKQIHFIAGLPRSGSTLLVNILNQHENVYALNTSGLPALVKPVKNGFYEIDAHKAMPTNLDIIKRRGSLFGLISGYYAEVENMPDVTHIFDKSRAWLTLIPTLQTLFGPQVKIIVTVRAIPEVLASLEKLYQRASALGASMQEQQHGMELLTIEDRVNFWLRKDQLLGYNYLTLQNAYRLFPNNLLIVDFKELTHTPEITMKRIQKAYDLPEFEYDFDNVQQTTWEDDRVHRFPGLHQVRSKVEPVESDWKDVIGDIGEKYLDADFWNKVTK